MATAEIITIGTEILLGEIVDTNTPHIARSLRAEGIDIYWTTSVGDNPARIAEIVRAALERSDIVVTTGGLGPTVDDPTREAVAAALGQPLEFRAELWDEVVAMFRRFGHAPTENNRRQAYIPTGALALSNPVGTAPAFVAEGGRGIVICLPGVPREMEHLLEHAVLPVLRRRFRLDSVIRVRVLHTTGVDESRIDAQIADLEALANPTVGLAAHAGQVDLRLTAKAASVVEAEALIAPVEAELRRRLGPIIYGADATSLADAAAAALAHRRWRLAVAEAGLGGQLVHALLDGGTELVVGLVLPPAPDPEDWAAVVEDLQSAHGANAVLAVALYPDRTPRAMTLRWLTPDGDAATTHTFGGHARLDARRGTNLALDRLRRSATEERDAVEPPSPEADDVPDEPPPIDTLMLSSHFDDAVFSCGGTIRRLAAGGRRVVVVTVCAAPPDGPLSAYAAGLHRRWGAESGDLAASAVDMVARRRAEDQAALAILGAEGIYLDLPDCIYRRAADGGWLYESDAAIFGALAPADLALLAPMAAALRDLPGLTAWTRVLGPLAVGRHVDHQLVRAAAEAWQAASEPARRLRLRYYEDYPYAEDAAAVAEALGAEAWQPRLVRLTEAHLAAKVRAMAAYASQRSTFWPSDEAMSEAITHFARRHGHGRWPAERLWDRVAGAVRTELSGPAA